jgi:hypothetical protein
MTPMELIDKIIPVYLPSSDGVWIERVKSLTILIICYPTAQYLM